MLNVECLIRPYSIPAVYKIEFAQFQEPGRVLEYGINHRIYLPERWTLCLDNSAYENQILSPEHGVFSIQRGFEGERG